MTYIRTKSSVSSLTEQEHGNVTESYRKKLQHGGSRSALSLVLSLQAVPKAALNLKHIQCFLYYVRTYVSLSPSQFFIDRGT